MEPSLLALYTRRIPDWVTRGTLTECTRALFIYLGDNIAFFQLDSYLFSLLFCSGSIQKLRFEDYY